SCRQRRLLEGQIVQRVALERIELDATVGHADGAGVLTEGLRPLGDRRSQALRHLYEGVESLIPPKAEGPTGRRNRGLRARRGQRRGEGAQPRGQAECLLRYAWVIGAARCR